MEITIMTTAVVDGAFAAALVLGGVVSVLVRAPKPSVSPFAGTDRLGRPRGGDCPTDVLRSCERGRAH